ncbi:hypothetical protein D3C77_565970 [compost metagenome]
MIQQRLYQSIDFVALARIRLVVIVIEERGVWVGLMRIFKRPGNELRSGDIQPFGPAQQFIPFVRYNLVDHIPSVNPAFITAGHRVDM